MLAFSNDYYGMIFRATQSVELFCAYCIRKQGVFETIKEERSVHGYGIKSMRRIVDKYQGLITYEEKEKIFITKITFFNV